MMTQKSILRVAAVLSAVLSVFCAFIILDAACALPAYARQTGQPCSACHVNAFGPQLNQYGRDFKTNGYVWDGGTDPFPVSAMTETSFTHTAKDQPGNVQGFGPNNNVALDQVSVFYGGRIIDHVGGFVQNTYDGVNNVLHWDNTDIRYADLVKLGKHDLVYGVIFNNNPTVQDPWNSTPAWGFPYASSAIAGKPATSTLVDGGLAQRVAGLGIYAQYNDLIYVELDGYRGLGRDVLNGLGVVPVSGATSYNNFIPYWRIALEHSFGDHYFELGTFGLSANQYPGGLKGYGQDSITDNAVDFTYQYMNDPDWFVSAYSTYIREGQALDATFASGGSSRASDYIHTLRAHVSVTYENTFSITAQHFMTKGSADALIYAGTSTGLASPNSSGFVGEVDYVPGGKPNSDFPTWFNPRLSLQYVGYTKFDGTSDHAGDNNTLYLLLWLAY